jgi:hypothetical protein
MKFLERFRRGEVLSADKLNKLVDLVNAMEITSDGSIIVNRSGAGTILSLASRNEAVPFYNNSGSTWTAYGIGPLTGIALNTGMPYYLTADKPGTTFYRYHIVNGTDPVPAGKVGFGYIVNGSHNRLCIAAYDSGSPAAGEEWGPKPSQFTLSKGYPGCFTVLGILDSTNKWMLGYLHPINELLGKTTTSHTAGSSHDVNIYSGTAGSEAIITSMVVPAYNRFHTIASGKWVSIAFINGQAYLSAGEC